MLVKTLAQANARLVSLADIDGQTTGTNPRHPAADNALMLSDSYRMVREHYTSKGFRYYVEPTSSGTGPSAPETGETYGVVDYPVTALSLVGFDVYDDGDWHPLEEVEWEDRRRFQQDTGRVRRPGFFALRSFGSVSGATEAAGKIAFFPFKASITYRLHILPEWADITEASHKFIFPNQSGYDLMIADAVFKIAGLRDGDKAKRVVLAQQMIERAKVAIGEFVPKVVSAGPKTVRRAPNYRVGRW